MSRGGRGRGRGGRLNIPGYDYDASLKLDSKPSELFPPYRVPIAAAPSEKEKREVTYYLDLREQIHKGPIYTKPQTRDPTRPSKTYGEEQFNDQYSSKLKPDIDPFEAMPRYSWKYDEKKRAIPQLSDRPFDKSLFPKELWPTLDGEESVAVRKTINKGIKRKADMISGSAKEKEDNSGPTLEEKTRMLMDRIKNVIELDEADPEVDREEDEEDLQEEERDYDYEEDEVEMGGDYGAEQYFDGGEGDDDDGGDAGGGDDF